MFECQRCGEITMVVVNTYTIGDDIYQEHECSECHWLVNGYVGKDADYDPSPETQEEVTRIGGFG